MKKMYKKILAFICAIAMVVTSMTGIAPVTVSAEDVVAVEDIYVDAAVKDFGEVTDYAYQYAWLCGATSEYQYMIITYTGDITNLRIQEVMGDDRLGSVLWVDQTQADHLTLVGDTIVHDDESKTMVIDLKASGFNLDECEAMDMHYGPGTLNIGYVRLSTSAEITDADVMPEPVVDNTATEDLELTGLVGTYAPEGTGYAYLGGMSVGKSGYQYLILSYTGDETAFKDFRIELTGLATIGMGENAYDVAAVDWSGEAIPAPSEEEQVVIIDLDALGLDITKTIEAIHLHTTAGNGSFEITDAWLWTPFEYEPLEDLTVEGLIKEWSTDLTEGYVYLGGMDVVADAGYAYLKLTYKGDATAFNDFRMQINDKTFGFGEIVYDGAVVTVDGEAVPAPTEEEQTVIIDLAATGFDIEEAITVIHMHQTAGNGNFEITDAVLMEYYEEPIDPSTLEDIILNGDEAGQSSMIKTWNIKNTGYKYMGFATLKEPNWYYRYLILTYSGDITSVRFEFAYVDADGNETEKTVPYWFNKEGQENYFVTADGSDIPLDGGKGTTIVIDLWETGIDLDFYNSVHMHAGYGEEIKDITFQIGMARLSTKADLSAVDVMPAEKPTENPTTEAPTTVEPTTDATVTVARAKVKKATKKLSAKKMSLKIKKDTNVDGYKVQISNTKKFKKILVKKNVKSAKATIASKKIKGVKKLFVRVKAYKVVDGKKVWSAKWSKAVKVKIK